ncbi:MAG: NADH-ubiquinone oxidoreductase-F iron-sulfur binding region domain-containing protein, partial [Acidimicrobiales bacterium]
AGGERLRQAIGERTLTRSIKWLVEPAHRYVAGETSAIVSALEGDGPRPHRRPLTVAAVGVGGRPTVVLNAETSAHLALIARFGAQWFRGAGSPDCPGSTLVTIVGNAPGSGTVVEIGAPVTIGELLVSAAGISRTPRAVLLGGYAGTWIPGDAAMRTPLERGLLSRIGTPLGCGLVGVLDAEDCGVAETARMFRWLAGQSSGQCGPCVLGLPAISELLDDLVEGVANHGDVRRLAGLAASVRGRGACGHPTAAVGLVESALETFRAEVRLHRRGTRCEARGAEIGFPLPPPAKHGKFS